MNEFIYKNLYKFSQFVRQEPVLQIYKLLQETQWYEKSDILEFQTRKLCELLKHAKENVLFYHGIPYPEKDSWEILSKISPTTKEIIRSSGETLISKNRIPSVIARSAGSTGIPISVAISKLSWAYHHANIFRALEWHGISPFEKQGRIWGRNVNKLSKFKIAFKDFIFNRTRLSVFSFTEKKCLQFYQYLNNKKIGYLYGYTSGILEFAQALKVNNLSGRELRLKAIFCTAEELTDDEKLFLEDFFFCKTVRIYGAAEVGIIGVECGRGKMHIPSESVVVQTLPEVRDRPGGQILVTDLNNKKMPLIRYQLGDSINLENEKVCECGRHLPIIEKIWGRTRKFFEINGKKISPAIFNFIIKTVFNTTDKLIQYQVVRNSNMEFVVYLHANMKPAKNKIDALTKLIKTNISEDITVMIEPVEKLPRNKMSGKKETFLDACQKRQN